MITRATLERSLEAVAADALWAASDVDELQDAWSLHCDMFADESLERARLLKLFNDRLEALRSAVHMAKLLRV